MGFLERRRQKRSEEERIYYDRWHQVFEWESRQLMQLNDPANFMRVRHMLEGKSADSSEADAVRDVADNIALSLKIRSLPSRLMGDLHSHPGGNFQHRTGAMFDDTNAMIRKNNEQVERMRKRAAKDPAYSKTVNVLKTEVMRRLDQEFPEVPVSTRASVTVEHLRQAIVLECEQRK